MKPVVGVMPLWDEERESIWMLPGYLEGLSACGALSVVFPFTEDPQDIAQLMAQCDGFLFTGGQDVSPQLYGEETLSDLVETCVQRDRMEQIVLQKAIAQDQPVLGICRGIQFINVALGGTLYQDLPTQHVSTVEHHQQAPYDQSSHEVEICAGTPLYECLQSARIAVNSYHHQAVKTLGDGLQAMAISEDGLIEALHMPEHRFLWAVQWHPEFSYQRDKNSRKIFAAFVNAMC